MNSELFTLLAINPGSTSTKIGVFSNETEIFRNNIEHSYSELAKYPRVIDQYELRRKAVLSCLSHEGIQSECLSAVVARGAPLPPMQGGAYRINKAMLDVLSSGMIPEHASNVAALIAHEIASPTGILAMIYDAISTDEMDDIARISGMPLIPRLSLNHTLNSRAVARKSAGRIGKPYEYLTFIVAHLGGGITVSLHKKGRIVDIVSDDEGPFSSESSGRVPCRQLIDLCYSGRFEHQEMKKLLRGKGGLVAYLGTNNAIEVLSMIKDGDKNAELILHALAFQVAKAIGELATVCKGEVDRIILTGGMAHSQLVTGWIKENVEFISPVEIFPGENELESLALGGLRVLKGEEPAREFELSS